MTIFTAKSYQQDVLNSVKAYFERIHEDSDANTAFYSITRDLWGRGIAYNGLEDFEQRVSVSDDYKFTFKPDTYVPATEYTEPEEFNYHYYPIVGNFDNSEELELARWLDQQAHKGRIKFWVRNLVRKPGASFSLQTTTDRFYPDFVCMLQHKRILVIENKGARDWNTAEEDRKIGKLWSEMSNGKCLFVMVKERKWEWIDSLLP